MVWHGVVCFHWNLCIGALKASAIAAAVGGVIGGVVCIAMATIAALALVVWHRGNHGNFNTCHFLSIHLHLHTY